MTDHNLNSLCRVNRGRKSAPGQANTYFVMKGGECVLATTIFNVANNLFDSWVQCQIKESCVLADRRSGDVATYYPTKGLTVDLRNEVYYQAVKYHVTEREVRELREAAAKQAQELREVFRPDVAGQWLVKHGMKSDTYFYVQHVQRNGKLRGFVLYFDHNARYEGTAMGQFIEKADIYDWKVAYIETVRALKLDSHV